jgi:hypothetical protein
MLSRFTPILMDKFRTVSYFVTDMRISNGILSFEDKKSKPLMSTEKITNNMDYGKISKLLSGDDEQDPYPHRKIRITGCLTALLHGDDVSLKGTGTIFKNNKYLLSLRSNGPVLISNNYLIFGKLGECKFFILEKDGKVDYYSTSKIKFQLMNNIPLVNRQLRHM